MALIVVKQVAETMEMLAENYVLVWGLVGLALVIYLMLDKIIALIPRGKKPEKLVGTKEDQHFKNLQAISKHFSVYISLGWIYMLVYGVY